MYRHVGLLSHIHDITREGSTRYTEVCIHAARARRGGTLFWETYKVLYFTLLPVHFFFGETPLWDQNTATSLLSLFVGSRGRALFRRQKKDVQHALEKPVF